MKILTHAFALTVFLSLTNAFAAETTITADCKNFAGEETSLTFSAPKELFLRNGETEIPAGIKIDKFDKKEVESRFKVISGSDEVHVYVRDGQTFSGTNMVAEYGIEFWMKNTKEDTTTVLSMDRVLMVWASQSGNSDTIMSQSVVGAEEEEYNSLQGEILTFKGDHGSKRSLVVCKLK